MSDEVQGLKYCYNKTVAIVHFENNFNNSCFNILNQYPFNKSIVNTANTYADKPAGFDTSVLKYGSYSVKATKSHGFAFSDIYVPTKNHKLVIQFSVYINGTTTTENTEICIIAGKEPADVKTNRSDIDICLRLFTSNKFAFSNVSSKAKKPKVLSPSASIAVPAKTWVPIYIYVNENEYGAYINGTHTGGVTKLCDNKTGSVSSLWNKGTINNLSQWYFQYYNNSTSINVYVDELRISSCDRDVNETGPYTQNPDEYDIIPMDQDAWYSNNKFLTSAAITDNTTLFKAFEFN